VLVQGRPVQKVNSSTRNLDEFLLSQAESNFDDYNSRWLIAASFNASPVTHSLPNFDLANLPDFDESSHLDGFQLPDLTEFFGSGGFRSVSGIFGLDGLNRSFVNRTDLKPVLTGHFTIESYHSSAISLALLDLAKLSHLAPAGYHIQTINHPLPRQPETVVMDKVVISFVIM